jgi:hypothetical protein
MNQSENIQELVAALSKAQGVMKPAIFNKKNPHFKNKYADFTSVMDACRMPLSSNGLSIMQYCETVNDKTILVTMLAHISGQFIKSFFPLNPKSLDSQAVGSALTYAKRYCLAAMIGVVADDDDDDAELATEIERQAPLPKKKITASQVAEIKKLEDQLDKDSKDRFYSWLNTTYEVKAIEDLPSDSYITTVNNLEISIKYAAQQKAKGQ